jgi:hypothetical protein
LFVLFLSLALAKQPLFVTLTFMRTSLLQPLYLHPAEVFHNALPVSNADILHWLAQLRDRGVEVCVPAAPLLCASLCSLCTGVTPNGNPYRISFVHRAMRSSAAWYRMFTTC